MFNIIQIVLILIVFFIIQIDLTKFFELITFSRGGFEIILLLQSVLHLKECFINIIQLTSISKKQGCFLLFSNSTKISIRLIFRAAFSFKSLLHFFSISSTVFIACRACDGKVNKKHEIFF